MKGSSSTACVVHLLHAASGRTLCYVASLETRVDVGTIASYFELQPNSLRLNGHFISRNTHFIAGLTWRPLLAFFHSRSLNTGAHALNPVEVQGVPLPVVEGLSSSKVEDDFGCHNKPQNAKRTAAQFIPVSSFKRSKQEQGSIEILALPQRERGHFEGDDTSCIWNKPVQQEVYSGLQKGSDKFQPSEGDVNNSLGMQDFLEDISTDRRHCKRMKLVRV